MGQIKFWAGAGEGNLPCFMLTFLFGGINGRFPSRLCLGNASIFFELLEQVRKCGKSQDVCADFYRIKLHGIMLFPLICSR